MTWSEVEASAALHGTLPATPVLLRGSPMQVWHAAHGDAWAVETVAALAAGTETGDYNVTLQWQTDGPLFMPHKGLESNGVTEPRFATRVVTLREAVKVLWAPRETSSRRHYYYLSASIEDFPPAVASAVLDFLPHGCVHDERFSGGAVGLWRPNDPDAHCRGLRANLWLGAAESSAATHFDLSHNLLFLASGVKRFRLLPPSAHHELRLHPSWHGSHLAAQTEPSDAQMQSLGGYEAVLEAGDVLSLPPGWFHRVTSESDNVGVNLWTQSLAGDVWQHLNGDAARWGAALLDPNGRCFGAGTSSLFRCARACLDALLGADLQTHTSALLASRYAGAVWDAAIPSFGTDEARRARERVAMDCQDVAVLGVDSSALLSAAQQDLVRDYAEALAKFDADELRGLVIDDFIEGFSRYIVGPAAATMAAAHLGDATVETFLRKCLLSA